MLRTTLLISLVLSVLFLLSWVITETITTSTEQQTQTAPLPAKTKTGEERAAYPQKTDEKRFSVGSVIFLGGILLVVVALSLYKATSWGERFSQPIFIAMVGVTILNIMAKLFIYDGWRLFWGNQDLFWGANIGLVLFAHFRAKKEPYAKFVANGIGLFILIGFALTAQEKIVCGDLSKEACADRIAAARMVSKDPIISILARCPGLEEEFNTTEKVSAAQKKYEEEGLLPWQKNIGCWEVRLTRDMLPVTLAIVEAPAEGWSPIIKNPQARSITDWPGTPAGCEFMPDGDEDATLPCEEAEFETPLKFFQFRSTTGEPFKVKVIVRRVDQ